MYIRYREMIVIIGLFERMPVGGWITSAKGPPKAINVQSVTCLVWYLIIYYAEEWPKKRLFTPSSWLNPLMCKWNTDGLVDLCNCL